jgi:hypothetical protein
MNIISWIFRRRAAPKLVQETPATRLPAECGCTYTVNALNGDEFQLNFQIDLRYCGMHANAPEMQRLVGSLIDQNDAWRKIAIETGQRCAKIITSKPPPLVFDAEAILDQTVRDFEASRRGI